VSFAATSRLASVRPSGEHLVEDLEAAGGARAVLKRLEPLADLDPRNVSGETLREILAAPLALVQDGDTIEIDVDRRAVDLDVSEAELEVRRAQRPTFGAPPEQGWLGMYQRLVQPVHKGAVLNPE
jgi:dihydroxyacid dehydratase/phosphogluconate dehydratase